MKASVRLSLLLVLLLGGCAPEPITDDEDATPTPASEPSYEPLPEDLAAAFDEERLNLGAPGLAVAILHGDRLYAQGFGDKDPGGGDPVQPSTLFRIGSMTKMLTAASLLQQVQSGAAALDDTLTDHVPGFAVTGRGSASDVTLHQLLSHQGGFSDLTLLDGGEDDARLYDFAMNDFPSQAYLMAPPGTFWNYSNPNFALAGLVIEQADGRPYRQVMQEDLLHPLGMERTLFLGTDVTADGDFATGLTVDWSGESTDEALAGAESYDDAFSRPAGFAWSSVLQMMQFASFLLEGDPAILDDGLRLEMSRSQVDTHASPTLLHYGYGLMIKDGRRSSDGRWLEIDTVEHGGAIPGFAAEMVMVPSDDLVVVTLASTDGAYLRGSISATVESLLGLGAVELPDPNVAEDLGIYVGDYSDEFNVGDIHISEGPDGLVADMPLLDDLEIPYQPALIPISRDNFAMEIQGTGMGITLIRDEVSGEFGWFRNRYFVGERVEDGGAAREITADPGRRARILRMLERADRAER